KNYQGLARKFLPLLLCNIPSLTRVSQIVFLISVTCKAQPTLSQEIGKSSYLQRENIDSPAEARFFVWGGGKGVCTICKMFKTPSKFCLSLGMLLSYELFIPQGEALSSVILMIWINSPIATSSGDDSIPSVRLSLSTDGK